MANPVVKIVLKAIDEATDQLNKIEGRFKSFGDVVGGAMKALGAVLAAAAIGKFLKDAATEALESEKSVARLGLAVQNAGGNFQALSPALEATIDGIKRLSKFSDEDLREALGGMITLTGDVAGSTKNLGLAADLAAARQIDLGTASDLVAKAMNGNTTALHKLGVQGTTTDEVLGNLRRSMGGAAENEAKTFGGQLAQLNVGWKDFQEEVGRAILSTDGGTNALGALGAVLKTLTDTVVENQAAIGAFAKGLADVLAFTIEMGKSLIDLTKGFADGFLDLFSAQRRAMKLIRTEGQKDVTEADKELVAEQTQRNDKVTKALGNLSLAVQAIDDASNKKRKKAAEDAGAASKKHHEDLASELVKINTDLAVRQYQIDTGATEAQATEYVRRQQILTGHITKTVDNVTDGYARLDLPASKLRGVFDQELIPAVQKTQTTLGNLVNAPGKSLESTAEALGITKDELIKLTDELAGPQTSAALEGLAKKLGLSTEEVKKLLGDKTKGAKGLDPAFRDAAAAVGLLDKPLGDALEKGIGLADSLMRAAGGSPTAIVGAIGSVVGIFSSLFGSASSAEAKRLLVLHTERLRALTDATGDLVDAQTSGNKFAAIAGALGNVNIGKNTGAELADALANAGVTINDLDKAAKDLGVTLRDKDGLLTDSGLKALLDAIKHADTAATNTFAGRVGTIDTKLSIGTLKKQDELGALLGAAGPDNLISKLLGGLDLNSGVGRGQGKLGLQSLFDDLSSGKLKLTDLGGLSRKEFEGLLVRLLGILGGDQEITLPGVTVGTGGIATDPNPFPDNKPIIGPGFSLSDGLTDLSGLGETTNVLLGDILAVLGGTPSTGGGAVGGGTIGAGVALGGVTINVSAQPGQSEAEIARIVIDELLALQYSAAQAVRGSAVRT